MQPNEQPDFVFVRITEKLANLAPSLPEPFIFKVHKELRSVNEKAYEPEIVAIGPYHHGKQNLAMMEEHKLRYLDQLLQRKRETNAKKYILALRSLELNARRCYAEPINLTTDEFVEMLLLDGCFVVEVILKFKEAALRDKNDPIFQMDWIFNSLQRDLMLFENQLPLSILCELFDLIEDLGDHRRFKHLAFHFFCELFSGKSYDNTNSDLNFKHLLGLIHNSWLPSYDRTKVSENAQKTKSWRRLIHNNWLPTCVGTKVSEHAQKMKSWCGQIHNNWLPSCVRTKVSENAQETKSWRFIPSTTELLGAGVKIKKAEEGSLFKITFESGVIRIPPLRIEDRTETYLRNLIAYEQYNSCTQPSYITDYVIFMDCLINTSKDVEILCHCKIIDNWLGDKEVVSVIFNKITDAVGLKNFQYAEIFDKLNVHFSKSWNKWLAKLWRDYFNGPWAVISVLAAFVLLVLTFTQTFFAVFPRKA